MNFRTELTILKLEPDGAMTVIESGASDGTIVVIRARVVEPLRVGDQLALTLTAVPAATAAPSMRERMQARIQESAGGPTPRLSVTLNNLGSGAAPASAASGPRAAGRASAPASASATKCPDRRGRAADSGRAGRRFVHAALFALAGLYPRLRPNGAQRGR
jgi:hypothetical protein